MFTLCSPAQAGDWTTNARRLTGESFNVRQTALVELRATPGIESTLRQALKGNERFLALDAIAALLLRSLLPDLVAQSETDETGSFYLAMNSLTDASNRLALAHLYRERLLGRHGSISAQVVLLDTLIRMQMKLDPKELSDFLFDERSPEVASAALYYLRSFLVKYADPDYMPLLTKVLEDPSTPPTRGLQALYTVYELPPQMWRSLRGVRARCPLAPPSELRTLCQRLEREVSR